MEDFRQLCAGLVERQPVREVVAEVVAAERLHRHRVAPQHADRAGGGGGGFRAHRGAHQHAVGPVARLHHQRQQGRPAATEHDRTDRHALRRLGLRRPGRALPGADREARIGMRGRAVGRVVRATLPVGDGRAGQAFPPRLVVGGDRHVGEDGVARDAGQRVGVGACAGARRHAEEAGLRVDRMQAAVCTRAHPADVVAHRPHLPAVAAIALRRNQHGQVGLAAGGRKRRGDVMDLPLRILDADDQHVLGQPALGAGLLAGDAQRVALLAQQRVAAIARAVGLDQQLVGKVHDEAALGVQFAGGMQAAHEAALTLDARLRGGAHARHDAHVGHHVGAVAELHAAARQRRVDRPHAVGNHVEGAAFHAAVEQRVDLRVGGGRVHPVVVWTAVLLPRMADQGQVLDARHIRRVRTVQVAVRVGLLVQLDQVAGLQHLLHQRLVFGVRSVAPVDPCGAGQRRHRLHPLLQRCQLARHRFPLWSCRKKEQER